MNGNKTVVRTFGFLQAIMVSESLRRVLAEGNASTKRRHKTTPPNAARCAMGNCYFSVLVQKAHFRAAIGTSLRHSGHFLLVGSGGTSPRFRRAVSAFIGTITKT
jgi:hypothetical protein